MSLFCWVVDGVLRWEAVTALATVVATGIILWQLHTLNKQIKLQQYVDYTKRYQDIVLAFPEDINESSFNLGKKRKDYSSVMRHMRAYFDLSFEEWDLHHRKLIDDGTWKIWKGGIHTAMSKKSFQQAWKVVIDTGTDYGPEFQGFIENAISEKKS